MINIIFLIYLLLLGFFDIRERTVPVVLLAAGSILALGVKLGDFAEMAENPKWFLAVIVFGAMPGMFMLGVSWMTDKAGAGDGWALINLGLFTDYKTCIVLWGASMLVMAVISAGLLALKKVKGSTRLPYLPFLAMAYAVIYTEEVIQGLQG